MSGIPASLSGQVAVVYGVSRHYETVDRIDSFLPDYTATGWLCAIRDSLLRIDLRGCMRSVVPKTEESLGENIFFRTIYRPYPFIYEELFMEVLQNDSITGVIDYTETDMPIGLDSSSVRKTNNTGPAPHLARLAVKASIAEKETCAVSLCAIGEEEVALDPPCGHICGPMARTLVECPTCRHRLCGQK